MATSTNCVTIEDATQTLQNLRISTGDCVSKDSNATDRLDNDKEYCGNEMHVTVSERLPQDEDNNNDKGSYETTSSMTKWSGKKNKNLQPGRSRSSSQLSQQCNVSHQQSDVETDGENNMTILTNSTKGKSNTGTTQASKHEDITSQSGYILEPDPDKPLATEHSYLGLSRTKCYTQTEQYPSLSENAEPYLDSPMTVPGTSQQPVAYVEKQDSHDEPVVQKTIPLGSCANSAVTKSNMLIGSSIVQNTGMTVEKMPKHTQTKPRPVHGEIEADAVLSMSSNGSFEKMPVDYYPEGQYCSSDNLSTLHQSTPQASNFSTQEMTSSSNSDIQAEGHTNIAKEMDQGKIECDRIRETGKETLQDTVLFLEGAVSKFRSDVTKTALAILEDTEQELQQQKRTNKNHERDDGDGQDTIGNPANDESGVEADEGGVEADQGNVEADMVPSVSSSTGSTMSLDSSSITTLSSCSSSSTSTSTQSITSDIGGRRDFVVLHTDNDSNEAATFIEQVETLCAQDSDIYPLVSIDMLINIGAIHSELGILGTLHDNYRYILTFVTHNLQSDVYTQFRNEVLITCGLQEGGNKVHRVIPVWAIRKRDCTSALLCLKCLIGFDYINNRNSTGTGCPNKYYKRHIIRTVKDGRKNFP